MICFNGICPELFIFTFIMRFLIKRPDENAIKAERVSDPLRMAAVGIFNIEGG